MPTTFEIFIVLLLCFAGACIVIITIIGTLLCFSKDFREIFMADWRGEL